MTFTRPRAPLRRDPGAAESRTYDLVVVGGGITGAMVALEGARRGLACLLLEADDFGGKASRASLRILHGGLRALQSLDLAGALAAAEEQLWFHRHFGDLVEPLPCLLPLHGIGLRRPSMLRIGLAAHETLRRVAAGRAGIPDPLPRGRLLSPARTTEIFPGALRRGLLGGALWHDLRMLSSERIVIETLRWAAALGARAVNYVRVASLRSVSTGIFEVRAEDRISGAGLRFAARAVVEAIGPGAGLSVGGHPDMAAEVPAMLAFNLLLDRPPPGETAIGVTPSGRGSRTYFLVPWNGRTLAGTFHARASPGPLSEAVTGELVARALHEIDAAAPGLTLQQASVAEIYPGWLPARLPGAAEPARSDTVALKTEPGVAPGVARAISVKFTTAHRAAAQAVQRLFPSVAPAIDDSAPEAEKHDGRLNLPAWSARDAAGPELEARLREVVEEEAVVELADLVLRRVDSVGTAGDRAALQQLALSLIPQRAKA
jgi:glycerol-3-phosphate dehydrogenase